MLAWSIVRLEFSKQFDQVILFVSQMQSLVSNDTYFKHWKHKEPFHFTSIKLISIKCFRHLWTSNSLTLHCWKALRPGHSKRDQ
jgi:hypothetical protein